MKKKMYKLKITIPLQYRLNILDFPEMDYSELNIENPKYLKKALSKLKYVQRKYSKNKGKRTKKRWESC